MRRIKIGSQRFDDVREGGYFYIDKTDFIREWWEAGDDVTLITRPRRFGKTFNMSMVNCFFSNRYAGRNDLFQGLEIWKDSKYRTLQGTYPVIFLSFADVKESSYAGAREAITRIIMDLFQDWKDLWVSDNPEEKQRYSFMDISPASTDVQITMSLKSLSKYLEFRYGRKCLILMDEYDTPLLEAYTNGYWNEMSGFIRSLFNSTFKSNPSLERGIMTGIIRISEESIFSDLNNIEVITTTSSKYETAFGFTDEEVNSALQEYGLFDQKQEVKEWYDGFTFGNIRSIYNPWSILKYLESNGDFEPYWANTSGNSLISYELRVSSSRIKNQMETLLNGGSITTKLDEQIVYSQLETIPDAIWSLFLATGYLKITGRIADGRRRQYELAITNYEVHLMFEDLISQWFSGAEDQYSSFMDALLKKDPQRAQNNLEEVLSGSVSFYDTAKTISESRKPESFYHGLVLGMIVQEASYHITSNRESGDGRYDILMMPGKKDLPAIIIEFKVFNPAEEKTLSDTADRALKQIHDRNYDAEALNNGITSDHILHYGMGFSGKHVVIHAD